MGVAAGIVLGKRVLSFWVKTGPYTNFWEYILLFNALLEHNVSLD